MALTYEADQVELRHLLHSLQSQNAHYDMSAKEAFQKAKDAFHKAHTKVVDVLNPEKTTNAPDKHRKEAHPAPTHTTRVDGPMTDWFHNRFGTEWYRLLAQQSGLLLSTSDTTSFKDKKLDFRPGLRKLRDRCHTASLAPDTVRTDPLAKEIMSLWTPLEPQLLNYQTRLKESTVDLRDQRQSVDYILLNMATYVQHYDIPRPKL
jgi:hypothetical protein